MKSIGESTRAPGTPTPSPRSFQIEAHPGGLHVIVDASRLSARAPQAPDALPGEPGKSGPPVVNTNTALERFVTASLVLGLAAEQQGDLFGLLTFSNKIGKTFVHAPENVSALQRLSRRALPYDPAL